MLKPSNFKDTVVLVALGVVLGGVALLILEKAGG
jgi:hypothetical protein